MMNISLLGLILGIGGCGLIVGVAVLVAWAVLDNARKKSSRDQSS